MPADAKFSKVIYHAEVNGLVLAIVNYPDVQKFNGAKLLIYKKEVWSKLDKAKIDPHFYPDNEGPEARFKPDGNGLARAMKLIDFPKETHDVTLVLLANILKNLSNH